MQADLKIRKVERGDIPSLLALYGQLHPSDALPSHSDSGRILEQISLYPGSAILAGFLGDAIVTTCALVVVPNLTRGGSPYALIENVVTDAQYRKRGYGRAVLEEAIASAWRSDCYKVMLLTGSKSPATLKFYQEAGFEQNKTGFQIRRIPLREH